MNKIDEEVLLEKHLLKTHCKDLVNMILENQAMFHFLNIPKVETPADRAKVLSQLPSNEVKSFQKLIDTLTGKVTSKSIFSNIFKPNFSKIYRSL